MYRYLLPLLVLVLIPGCGILSDLLGLTQETGSSELKVFKSQQELTDYFTDQVNARQSDLVDDRGGFFSPEPGGIGGEDADTAAGVGDPQTTDGTAGGEGGDANSSDDEFSQTTTQEEGVDEADVVKTDGNYVYVIDGQGSADGSGLLRIVDVSPPEELTQVSEFPLQGYGRDIYLYDGKVVALTETYGGYYWMLSGATVGEPTDVGDPGAPVDDGALDADMAPPEGGGEYEYARPSTIVTILDVSDVTDPTLLSETTFEGTQVSSRMIDGVLHLALANYQEHLYGVMPTIGEPRVVLEDTDVEVLLPDFARVDGDGGSSSGDMVTWRELYHPADPDGFGMVTLVSLDVDADAAFTAVGVVAEPGLVYSSLDALYLTDTEYNFSDQIRETTDIYKFAYVGRGAEPRATGSVPGRVLNQYSMGEYDGYLRVATTIQGDFTQFFERTEPSNSVYVLGEAILEPVEGAEDEGSTTGLVVVGKIENIAVGEDIRSARFVGDRGYLVTFEQIDPLFTLNLKDPANPSIVGELKIPGFSTFLVPMDADHLLAIGQYIPDGAMFWNGGVQLTIFDVSDFAHPTEMDKVVLGSDGSVSSEALYNPKAFTYFAEQGLVAIPISIYQPWIFFDDIGVVGVEPGDDGVSVDTAPDEPANQDIAPPMPEGFDGLVVFSATAEDGLAELGRISTRFDPTAEWWYGPAFTRGVFIGDDVFAVTNKGVRGSAIADPGTALYELTFE